MATEEKEKKPRGGKVTPYSKTETNTLYKIGLTDYKTWKEKLEKMAARTGRPYGGLYFKALETFKKRNQGMTPKQVEQEGIASPQVKKRKENPPRQTHKSALKKNTPLEFNQAELRFPISGISIQIRKDGGMDFVAHIE